MVDPESQVKFCSLLTYFHHGDYAAFKRSCDLAFNVSSRSDRFAFANLLMCAQISGLVDVSETDRSTWWWTSFNDDISIHSYRSKIIGTTNSWLKTNTSTAKPIIFDGNDQPLLFGTRVDQRTEAKTRFEASFFSRFPSFRAAESQVCLAEQFRIDLGTHVDEFDPKRAVWSPSEPNQIDRSVLVRAKKEFSGATFFVVIPELGLLFRILNHEWAFIAALHLLNWSPDYIVQFRNDSIITPRVVRLPSPIYRFLFASSERVSVGAQVVFHGVDQRAAEWLRKYFSKGQQHAA